MRFNIIIDKKDEEFKAQIKINDKRFEIINNEINQSKPHNDNWFGDLTDKEKRILLNILSLND